MQDAYATFPLQSAHYTLYFNCMDFLDPRKRRNHTIRLMIGYCLTAIAIGLTSVILVYGAYGYGIDTKTGNIIQNGLVFIDSKPGGADIYLNGQFRQASTAARLTLPEGKYDLMIKRAGYRDFRRSFTLNEHSIVRYTYPFLFPVSPQNHDIKIYAGSPPLLTQSPDKHWLLAQVPSAGTSVNFDSFDTSKLDQPPVTLALPANLLSGNASGDSLKAVEWAADNNHLLLQHTFKGGNEFIVFNRGDPASSFNVNRTFAISPSQVALRNKKSDQLYLFQKEAGLLQVGDVAKASVAPVLTHVLAFKSYGTDLLSYVTDQNVATGQVMARIRENGKNYPLYTFAAGNKYLLDAAQFQGHWYYVAGSDKADRINIYEDPLSGIKDPNSAKAIPLIALSDSDVSNLAFSDNERFIGVQAGQKFGMYDIETQSRYQYTLDKPLTGEMHWMDGHHLIGLSGGSIIAMDADSYNQQTLVPADSGESIFFDKNYNQMFSLISTDGGTALRRTDLRAGADLPK